MNVLQNRMIKSWYFFWNSTHLSERNWLLWEESYFINSQQHTIQAWQLLIIRLLSRCQLHPVHTRGSLLYAASIVHERGQTPIGLLCAGYFTNAVALGRWYVTNKNWSISTGIEYGVWRNIYISMLKNTSMYFICHRQQINVRNLWTLLFFRVLYTIK